MTGDEEVSRAVERRGIVCYAAYAAIVLSAFFASGTGRLLGDEITFARAAHTNPFGTFAQGRFYRVLGNPVHNFVYVLAGDSTFILTLAAMLAIAATIFFVTRAVVRGFGHETARDAAMAAILVCALPFSLYGLLVRVVFSQLVAVMLFAGTCAAAFSYTALDQEDKKGRRFRVAVGFVTYLLSVFTYEVTLLTPLAVFCILIAWTPPGERRRTAIREWVVALGGVFILYVLSQAAFPAANPKLVNGVQPHNAARIRASLKSQALGKFETLSGHITWAWRLTAAGMKQGDPRAWAAIVASIAAALGAGAFAHNHATIERRKANAIGITGLAIFVSTMGLWSFYWFRDAVLTTPPMYTMLLPNCGVALVMLALFARAQSGKLRVVRVAAVIAIATAGVGTNVAILNANRILKDTEPNSEAAVLLITGQR